MDARIRRPATATAVVLGLGVAAVVAAVTLHAVAGGRQVIPVRGHAAARQPAPASGPLHLVTGSGLVNGIYTDYPHSQAGAVSAAVEFMTELGSALNPDRAAAVARLAADRSYRTAPQDAAASAIAARRALGLPASGPLPPATAAFLVPVMYQLRGVSPGQLTVLLLYDYTLTTPSGVAEHVGVTAVRLTWTPVSWRLLRPSGHYLAALLATPGTASATAKGWEAMTDGM